jgi:hypothetical protein
LTREPNFDELIGAEASGAERERLLHAHELLVQAGPPPELPPSLQKAPSFGVFDLKQRRVVKRRALVLLAAALSIIAVFFAGYAVRGGGSGTSSIAQPPRLLALKGTSLAPNAHATLAVWHSRNGNWPMRLSVAGLPKLPPRTYYEVYLVRNGKPWGSCGAFRIASNAPSTVTLPFTAPYSLRKGDSWVVTRQGPRGGEPGQTVLRPISA